MSYVKIAQIYTFGIVITDETEFKMLNHRLIGPRPI